MEQLRSLTTFTNLQHDPTLTCEQPRKKQQKRSFALAVDIIDSDGVIQTNTVGFTSDLSSIYISLCCRIWRRVQDVQIQNPADKSIVQSCVFSSYLGGGFQHFQCLMLLSKAGSCKGLPIMVMVRNCISSLVDTGGLSLRT